MSLSRSLNSGPKTSQNMLEAQSILSRMSEAPRRRISKLFADTPMTREFAAYFIKLMAKGSGRMKPNAEKVLESIMDVPLTYYSDSSNRAGLVVWPAWPHILAEITARAHKRDYTKPAVHALNSTTELEQFSEYHVGSAVKARLEIMGLKIQGIISNYEPPPVQLTMPPIFVGPAGMPPQGQLPPQSPTPTQKRSKRLTGRGRKP